ncbi:hypothetical protein Poli38472_008489 [Pythium oligandrum]|uniref:Glutaredoxin domain-containing protein n=1 Tax=Pythium oligandrum TaxID=41045 RepID=A0A8K1C3M5_PYTOL|nr:hypothetical protein Poli38472_008489 [Pythium oligandrum]|eukprot:TMW55841.1 hypothetical protein Poli38472_008489 [Pythium oligandrum]
MWTRYALRTARPSAMRVQTTFGSRRTLHVEATKDSIQNAIQQTNVLLFTQDYCGDCISTKVLFEDLEADHQVVNLSEREDANEIRRILNELTEQAHLPVVFIKGKLVGGYDEAIALHRDDKLEEAVTGTTDA